MLKGESKLVISHETMRVALEEYLRRGLINGEALTVQTIRTTQNTYNEGTTFDVITAEVPAAPAGE